MGISDSEAYCLDRRFSGRPCFPNDKPLIYIRQIRPYPPNGGWTPKPKRMMLCHSYCKLGVNMKMSIAVISLALLAFGAEAQTNCQTYGTQRTCTDSKGNSSTTQTYGNQSTTTYSDGTSANTQRYGNQTATTYSDGTSASTQRYGNQTSTTYSDGTSSTTQRYGNQTSTTYSDGRTKTCQTYGNQTQCN